MSENQNTRIKEDSLTDQIRPFLKVWPWVILSILLCLSITYIYLRYATKEYQATASIIIKDTQFGGGLSEVGVLGDIGLFGNNFNSVENEIEILHSKRLLMNVIDYHNLNMIYSKKGNVKVSEVYKDRFLNATHLLNNISNDVKETISFDVKYVDDSLLAISENGGANWQKVPYNEPVIVQDQLFNFEPNEQFFSGYNIVNDDNTFKNEVLTITYKPKESFLHYLHSKLNVVNASKRGSVLKLSITDVVPERAVDILNQLIVEYNEDATNDKNIVALNTAKFIDERLNEITKNLDSVESGIETFKKDQGLTDLEVETALDLQRSNEIEENLLTVETQLSVAQSLLDYMSQDIENSVTTSGLGLDNAQLSSAIEQYNKVLVNYNRIGKTSTQENPRMIQLTAELSALQKNILNTLKNYIRNLSLEKNSLIMKLNQVDAAISKVPINEKTSRNVLRNREIVEAIYLLLREKQETTAISLAVTAPKAKIVDSGYAAKTPVSPKPKILLLAAIILGALIPLGFVYLRQLFYNKIESRKDLERNLPEVSILGEIPKLESDTKDRIVPNDRSVLSEAFRIIRTNLQYKLGALNSDQTPVVLVTSTVKGEGKTTAAFNLASTFAYSGKKVLLIGGDIRNPQLHRFFNKTLKRKKGLTDYLSNPELSLEELRLNVDDNQNLDMLLSGAIPPNPAELLMQDRVSELFATAKLSYDLVIIDTAPTIVVTDTFLINKHADVTVYVSRANYTDKNLLEFVSDTIKEGKLDNVAMIINGVKMSNFGYGNKYGYSYGADKNGWFQRLKTKLNL